MRVRWGDLHCALLGRISKNGDEKEAKPVPV